MITLQPIPSALRVFLFASAFLYSVENAAAARDVIDPFSFCIESCKPKLCKESSALMAQCQKMCDSMWEQVASLQMSRDNKEFRMEKPGSPKKKSMLYQSPIAHCLEKKEEPLKEKEAVKEPVKADSAPNKATHNPPKASGNVANNAPTIKDLCAAAIKKEMEDLKVDTGALAIQSHNLEKALKEIEAAKN